jgi:hypothetical protein
VHLAFPPGYTHLHQDTVPEVGGDTLWVRFLLSSILNYNKN